MNGITDTSGFNLYYRKRFRINTTEAIIVLYNQHICYKETTTVHVSDFEQTQTHMLA